MPPAPTPTAISFSPNRIVSSCFFQSRKSDEMIEEISDADADAGAEFSKFEEEMMNRK